MASFGTFGNSAGVGISYIDDLVDFGLLGILF